MNDLQLYCFLMFWAGVLLTRLIFHVEKKWAEKETYNEFSVSLIKFLWVICFLEQSKQAADLEDHSKDSILEGKDHEMRTFTNILMSAMSEKQRSKLGFKSWKDVKNILQYKERETN